MKPFFSNLRRSSQLICLEFLFDSLFNRQHNLATFTMEIALKTQLFNELLCLKNARIDKSFNCQFNPIIFVFFFVYFSIIISTKDIRMKWNSGQLS